MTKLNEKSQMIGNLEISFWFDELDGFWHSSVTEWEGDKWVLVSSVQSLRKELVEEMYNQNIQWAETLLNRKEAVINYEEAI